MSWNLTVSLMLAVIAVSAVEISFNYLNASRKAEIQLESKADEYIGFLESSLQYALWYVDQPAIRRIGESLSKDDLIVSIRIADSEGRNLFVFQQKTHDAALRREKTVFHNGKHAGNIEISLSQQYYKKIIWQILRSSLITISVVLLSLIVLTGLLLRIFLREPLRFLNQIVDAYTSGNYDVSDIPYTEFYPFVALLRKMGEQIRTQIRELKTAEKRYRSIFENAIEGIFQSTPQGVFLNVNPSFARIFGYDSPEEMISSVTNISDQLYANPEDRKTLDTLLQQHQSVRRFETQFYRKDGNIITGALSVRLIRGKAEEELRYEGSLIDTTEQKQTEEQLRKHREHLEEMVAERTSELRHTNQMLQIEITERQKIESELKQAKEYLEEALRETHLAREEAESASKAKSIFFANMSHEIRTPINAIMGLSHLLLQSEMRYKHRDYLSKIYNSARSLLRIINDILDFSKLEAGKSEIRSIDFNLNDILNALFNRIRKQAYEKGLEFSASVAEDLPRCLKGDPLRLRQILLHLIDNALKFTEKGSIGIDVGLKNRIADQITLCFSVRDTGIGIAQEKLSTLFNPFTQADSSLSRKFKGMGLGLAICKKMITLMSGDITVESEPGKGSTFVVTADFSIGDSHRKSVTLKAIAPYNIHEISDVQADYPHISETSGRDIRYHIFKLWNFLKKRDIRAADNVEFIRQDMIGAGLEEQYVRLEKYITDYDFADARKLIEDIGRTMNIPLKPVPYFPR